jgi:hypothetical protein
VHAPAVLLTSWALIFAQSVVFSLVAWWKLRT